MWLGNTSERGSKKEVEKNDKRREGKKEKKKKEKSNRTNHGQLNINARFTWLHTGHRVGKKEKKSSSFFLSQRLRSWTWRTVLVTLTDSHSINGTSQLKKRLSEELHARRPDCDEVYFNSAKARRRERERERTRNWIKRKREEMNPLMIYPAICYSLVVESVVPCQRSESEKEEEESKRVTSRRHGDKQT